jgi:hypothetical protein
MARKWNIYTGIYSALEGIIGLGLLVLGVIFERNRTGKLFTNAQQERFAHLVLSYGSLLFTITCVWGYCVLNTLKGFLLLSGMNLILGLISIVFGIFMIFAPLSILQHGFIEKYIKTAIDQTSGKPILAKEWLKYLFAGIGIAHGALLILHAFFTFVKRQKLRPQFKRIHDLAAMEVDIARRNSMNGGSNGGTQERGNGSQDGNGSNFVWNGQVRNGASNGNNKSQNNKKIDMKNQLAQGDNMKDKKMDKNDYQEAEFDLGVPHMNQNPSLGEEEFKEEVAFGQAETPMSAQFERSRGVIGLTFPPTLEESEEDFQVSIE